MSNPSHTQINPATFTPGVLQAMQAAHQIQQGMNNNSQPNAQQGFQNYHQAFQRLHSQEAGKIEQQRSGLGIPNQPQQQQQPQIQGNGNGNGSGTSQQQFMQMMQQAQAQGQVGVGQIQGMQMNVHSAQQGLTLPGMPDTEAERRQLLHK